ncbi:MAG: adenylate/guanylate cyclase domain-containing protein [Rhizobiaceae bacterium]
MSQQSNFRVPVSVTIATCFVTLVVLLLGSVVWLGYKSSRANAVTLVANQAQQSISFVSDEIRDHLDPVVEQANWAAQLVSSGEIDLADQKQLGYILLAAVAATPQVTALVFVSRESLVTRAYRSHALGGWKIDTQPPIDSAFVQRTLNRAEQNQLGVWNEILFSDVQLKSYVNFIRPVWRGNEFQGAVLAAVSLNELSDLVSDISTNLLGTIFILDDRNHVIAHPNLTTKHPDLSKNTPLVSVDRVGDIVLSKFWSAKTHPVLTKQGADGLGIRQTEIAGQRFVFVSKQVSGYSQMPWTVGAYIDAKTAEAPFESVRNSLIIGLIAIAFGATIAIYLGRSIGRPIRVASTGISKIAELEIEQVEKLPGSQIAELDAQASAFNKMLGALQLLAIYIPKSLVRRQIRLGGEVLKSEQRAITVLFTDLVGFTSASEKMSASETARFLNHHFTLLANCVEEEGGTIDKYMGDALMAFWGAPEVQTDHTERAVRAACAMARAVTDDNERQIGKMPRVRMRIGIHCGPALVGNIGAPGRINYTVVGDTVNTAQRMEQLGKQVAPNAETVVLGTQDVVAAIDQSISYDAVGEMKVRGKTKPVKAFQLTSREAFS